MASSPPGQNPLLSAWGSIQQAMRDPELRSRPGGVTQYVWEAWKQSWLGRGLQPPPATIQQMNALMGQAGRQRQAETNLNAAINTFKLSGRDQALTAMHVSPDIDSRSAAFQPMGPNYRVRFSSTFIVEGLAQELHFTWEPGLTLPASVGELLDALTDADTGFGEDYGITFVGLGGSISITTV